MVHILDHTAKDITDKTAVIAECIYTIITFIVDHSHQDVPLIPVLPRTAEALGVPSRILNP